MFILFYYTKRSQLKMDINERCRVCLENQSMKMSVYEEIKIEGIGKELICKILLDCGNIQVTKDDNKPQNICLLCTERAREAYKFKVTCEKSNEILQSEIIETIFENCDQSHDKIHQDETIGDLFVSYNDDNIDNTRSELKMEISSTIITNVHNLNVGQTFKDYDEITKAFKAFCQEFHHPFVIRTRSPKQIVYKCCHGIRQTSKSQGKRPNQRYNYNGCEAQVNLYKGKNNNWKITKMAVDHNHIIGREISSYYVRTKDHSASMMDLFLSSPKEGMYANVLTNS